MIFIKRVDVSSLLSFRQAAVLFHHRFSPLPSFLHTMIAGAGRRSVMRKDKIDGGERCFSLTADAAAGDADPAADADA